MLHDRHILQDRISRDNAAGTYKIHALPVNLQGGSQKVAHTSTQHTFGVVQDKHTHTHPFNGSFVLDYPGEKFFYRPDALPAA